GFVSVLVVVAIGLYIYTKNIETATPGGTSPKTIVDVTGVNNDLMAIANAERRYWATNSKYGSLNDLQANGDIQVPHRASYAYSAEVAKRGFKIVPTYSGADPKAPGHISIDETMSLKSY